MKLYDLEKTLYQDNLIFTFTGIVSYNFLTSTSMVIKKDIEDSGETGKRVTNLFSVITELFQNIMNYSAKKVTMEDKSLGIGTCVIKRSADLSQYIVSAGNMVTKEDEGKIRERLDKIISLDKDGLKAYYKEVRKSGKDSHDKGAGLGFIQAARKSDHKLNYTISEIDDDFSYFEIEIII